MFDVSIADGFITNSQKNILEEIIKTFIQAIPGLKNINDLIRIQIKKQSPGKNIVPDSKPRPGGGIKIAFETKKIEDESDQDQPSEIIAEVHKEGGNYRAKIRDTGKDITGMIDNPAKLKYAYERSGLVRGKRNKDGSYDWRVVRKNRRYWL